MGSSSSSAMASRAAAATTRDDAELMHQRWRLMQAACCAREACEAGTPAQHGSGDGCGASGQRHKSLSGHASLGRQCQTALLLAARRAGAGQAGSVRWQWDDVVVGAPRLTGSEGRGVWFQTLAHQYIMWRHGAAI
jgi:hypothetical protein